MVARVGLGCSLIGMRWPLSLRYSLVPRPPSHFNWCHRIVEWELTQREISERRCGILPSMVARVGLGCSLIGMRWPLSLRYSLVPRPPSHFNWCHRIVEWENRPLTQREISERRAWENLSREGKTEVEPDLIGAWALVSMNHTYLTYAAGLKHLQSSGHTSPQQSNLWLQQQPANDAGCFIVAAIGGERVCMFRMRGCPPTLMKFTTFVT